MNEVIAGIGIFDLQPTHKMCNKCPYMEIDMGQEVFYSNGEAVYTNKPKCVHIEMCKRAYERGLSANLSCPTVKE